MDDLPTPNGGVSAQQRAHEAGDFPTATGSKWFDGWELLA